MRFIYTKTFAAFFTVLVLAAVITWIEVRGFTGLFERAFLQLPKPLIKFSQSVARPMKVFFSTVYNLKKISQENTELSNKLLELELGQASYDLLKLENEALKKELTFSRASRYKLRPCNVQSQYAADLADTLVIACGQNLGLKSGQAVLSGGFLAGKLVAIGKASSTVLLLTNDQSAIDAKFSSSGVEALVKGFFGSGIVMDLIPQSASVKQGDLIVTAGINNLIPKDIAIGEVGERLSRGNDLFNKVTVKSPINFHNLEFVFVVE